MIFLRAAGVILALAVIGYLLCPFPVGECVDPNKLLENVFEKQHSTTYRAVQLTTCEFYGKTLKRVEGVLVSPSPQPSPARGEGVSRPVDCADTRLGGSLALHCDRDLVKANYRPTIDGSDVVAGRQTWALRLQRRVGRRSYPWKQLWVDKETGVILASRDWSGRNVMKSSMETLSIRYAGRASSAHALAQRVGAARTGYPAGRDILLPRYVPRGFRLFGAWHDAGSGRAHIVYGDGLYVLSVFESVSDGPAADGRVCDWGQGLVLSTRSGRVRITVMGDLPVTEIRKVAASF